MYIIYKHLNPETFETSVKKLITKQIFVVECYMYVYTTVRMYTCTCVHNTLLEIYVHRHMHYTM